MECFLKDCINKVLITYKSLVIENFKPVRLWPIKCQPFEVFAKLHKSPLLTANIVKEAVSGLRQFLATESPLKMIKNAFYLTMKALSFPKIFKFLS